jgi:diaminopropionate ammonia-lyase
MILSGSETGIIDVAVNDAFRAHLAFAGASTDAMDEAFAAIRAEPDYRPTPLVGLPALANRLGLGAILCKDESFRFGAGGVKALGAPHGLRVLLRSRKTAGPFVAVAATDGNHGLALAWAARRQGGLARIYVGRDVDEVRLGRIRAEGAEVVVVDGTYDEAVLAAEVAARQEDALLVTDTDYDGGSPVCVAIMAGYGLLAEEAWQQGLSEAPPSHVFVQCGVGGVAGGIAASLWRRMTPEVPRLVTVEPASAACVLASLRGGAPTPVGGDLRTRMAGLACGRMSAPAWKILSHTAFAGLALGETVAETVQRVLVAGAWGDAPLSTWDTGVAGLAGLVAAASDDTCRGLLKLDRSSRILVINTEGPPPLA